MTPSRVLVAGLGKDSDWDLDAVRAVAAESCRRLRRAGVASVATIAHGVGAGGLDAAASGQAIAEGALLGVYRFDKYKSDNGDGQSIAELSVVEVDASNVEALKAGVSRGAVIAEAVNLCRDMANEPANFHDADADVRVCPGGRSGVGPGAGGTRTATDGGGSAWARCSESLRIVRSRRS